MKKYTAWAALVGAAILMVSPVLAEEKPVKESKALKRFRALTPESALAVVSAKDDDLEVSATFTTQAVFQEKQGLLGLVPFDVFLRAFVDKKSGVTRYQVYISSFYMGSEWAFWSLANYETPDGPKSVDLDILGRDVGSCSQYMGCQHTEVVAFDIDEALLRAAAAMYKPGELQGWKFKIKGKSGVERTDGLSAAEIAGLLMAVDAYKLKKGFAKTS